MDNIHIEVVYALPDSYFLKKVTLKKGENVQDAILQSGVLQHYPDIDLTQNKMGIFSRPVKLNEPVNDGDRVEIYRPLVADPKEIRRKRAQQQLVAQKAKKK